MEFVEWALGGKESSSPLPEQCPTLSAILLFSHLHVVSLFCQFIVYNCFGKIYYDYVPPLLIQ